jgi:hypothetical protein
MVGESETLSTPIDSMQVEGRMRLLCLKFDSLAGDETRCFL